jgi:hypothetical protein
MAVYTDLYPRFYTVVKTEAKNVRDTSQFPLTSQFTRLTERSRRSEKKSRLCTGTLLRDCKGRLEMLWKGTSIPGLKAWRDDATSRIAF